VHFWFCLSWSFPLMLSKISSQLLVLCFPLSSCMSMSPLHITVSSKGTHCILWFYAFYVLIP
jgi:hypothetical protein